MPCPHASADLDRSHIQVSARVESAKTQPGTYIQSSLVDLYMPGDTTVSAQGVLMARE